MQVLHDKVGASENCCILTCTVPGYEMRLELAAGPVGAIQPDRTSTNKTILGTPVLSVQNLGRHTSS